MTYVFVAIRVARRIAHIHKPPSLQRNSFTHGSSVRSTTSPNFGQHVEDNEPNSIAATQISSQPTFSQSTHPGSSASCPNPATRHLTTEEVYEYRDKGKCYRCIQPYGPLHKCAAKYLTIIEADDDELGVEG
ncbi:hypothetical protein ACS0TY_021405 [Phlomoides rotata]